MSGSLVGRPKTQTLRLNLLHCLKPFTAERLRLVFHFDRRLPSDRKRIADRLHLGIDRCAVFCAPEGGVMSQFEIFSAQLWVINSARLCEMAVSRRFSQMKRPAKLRR